MDYSLILFYKHYNYHNFSYYSWSTAAPIIASLLVFKQPLPDSTMASLANNRLEPDRRRYSLREWSRWWSRSSSIERPINNIEEAYEEKAKQETEKVFFIFNLNFEF